MASLTESLDRALSSSILRRLKTPAPRELARAHALRRRLVRECLRGGAKLYGGNLSKIYTGRLSPGCAVCAAGAWSCLYLNQLCTQRCFYCPQDRDVAQDPAPFEGQLQVRFDSPQDYAAHLRAFKYRGAGFSGGEPFLAFDALTRYVAAAREALGPRGYIWAYTNGELVTERKLEVLVSAGLDELRFDLSARAYDSSALELALKRVKRVAIEIPSIPEDFETLAALLPRWSALGVRQLNLHQLLYTRFNYKAFESRGYSAVHNPPGVPVVLESELNALRLIRFSLERRIRLPINYCSLLYKNRFQLRAARTRRAALALASRPDPNAAVTQAGYVRSLRGEGPSGPAVSYGAYRLQEARAARKVPDLMSVSLASPLARAMFEGLFLDKKTPAELRRRLLARFALEKKQRQRLGQTILRFRDLFRDWEHLAGDLPSYSSLSL